MDHRQVFVGRPPHGRRTDGWYCSTGRTIEPVRVDGTVRFPVVARRSYSHCGWICVLDQHRLPCRFHYLDCVPARQVARINEFVRRLPQHISDHVAIAINRGNGWRVARVILNARTVDKAERLFRDFISSPYRHREERVFAAYWVRTCRLQGLSRQDCWQQTAFAAVEHEQKTGNADFWGRVISEVGEIVQEVYRDVEAT